MEQIYKDVVPEFQSLLAVYHMERETACRQRKLRKFPTFDQWKRVGSLSSNTQTSTTIESLTVKPTVVTYPEYLLETKRHSRGYLYFPKQHSTKRPGIVYYLAPSSKAVKNPLKPRFGVIERLYSHAFAQRYFMWAAVSLYKEPCYDSSSGLWCSERFKNSFLVRSCIDNEFYRSVSFVNEIDDVVYILKVLGFFIFTGCYYLFRTLSLSFY